jgi:nucleoside-diphosphate-sugar epimerase
METMQSTDYPKRVLLTGAAGFIGSRTAAQLLESGVEVFGVDNLNDYYDPRIKEHRLATLRNSDAFRFVQGDIEDTDAVLSWCREFRPEAIVNLAARAGVRYSMVDPHVYLQTNAQGTLNFLEAMRELEIPKMVLASTSSLYAGHPLPFTEDMPVNRPISSYAASKKAAELLAHAHHHLYGLDISVVRYFTVYGPAGRPDMCIFRFIRWIDEGKALQVFGDGKQSRDFTYVDDVAQGTIAALNTLGYEIINIGGGKEPVDLLSLIQMIEDCLGKKATIEFQDPFRADVKETRADIGKAEELLGWRPRTGLREGVEASVQWYLENREWVNRTELP